MQYVSYGVREGATWGPILVDELNKEWSGSDWRLRPKRRYRGDGLGDFLVMWLNEKSQGKRNCDAYSRVCLLLDSVRRVNDPSVGERERQQTTTSIQGRLSHYSMSPQPFRLSDHRGVSNFFAGSPSAAYAFREHAAVSAILSLSPVDLSNVCRCAWCGRWMYKKFAHQRLCTDVCRIQLPLSIEYKTVHAAKQRVLDALHRQGKVKERSQAE
jgi:hypothetical protein